MGNDKEGVRRIFDQLSKGMEGEIMEKEKIKERLNKILDEREEEIMTPIGKKINSVFVKLNTQMMKREDEVKGFIYRLEQMLKNEREQIDKII